MPASSLRGACPALKDILWNVDTRIMVDLETSRPSHDDEHGGMTIIDQYAQELFDSPALERFAIQGVIMRGNQFGQKGKVRGTVFWRAEDGTVNDPVSEPVSMGIWRTLYSGLVSLGVEYLGKC